MTDKLKKKIFAIRNTVRERIFGQEEMIDKMIVALLCNEHTLIEGLPGTGKTTAVKIIADAIEGIICKRVQFTPDLQPTDLIGGRTIDNSGNFVLQKGKIYCHILIADEINRAPSKVQSALLEVMQERKITRIDVDDEILHLDDKQIEDLDVTKLNEYSQRLGITPRDSEKIKEEIKKKVKFLGELTRPNPDGVFCVFATQNPIEQEGTFPLAEAALDRFFFMLKVGELEKEYTKRIIETHARFKISKDSLEIRRLEDKPVEKVITLEDLKKMQNEILDIELPNYLQDYINCICRSIKVSPANEYVKKYVRIGPSVRAYQAMVKASKAYAYLENKEEVTISDVQRASFDILRHRIKLTFEAINRGINTEDIIEEVLNDLRYRIK